MITTSVDIRRAGPEHVHEITELLASAYLPGPVSKWLIRYSSARHQVYRKYFRIFVEHALRHGIVDITGNVSGVAIWHPRTRPWPEPASYPLRLADACGPWLDRFVMLDDSLAGHQPAGPHHQLAYLAVTPGQRHARIGSALLHHHHRQQLDDHGTFGYLVATSPEIEQFCTRNGYRAARQIRLPDFGPTITAMTYHPPRPSPAEQSRPVSRRNAEELARRAPVCPDSAAGKSIDSQVN